MKKRKWDKLLSVVFACFMACSTIVAQAACPCNRDSKHYISQGDVKIDNGKIQVKVNGKYFNAPAVFSDEKGYFIPSSIIADNEGGKKTRKPCRQPNWECKKCNTCNEYWNYWCSSCATPISAQ